MGQGLSGWVAENDTPIVNGNPAVEPGYLNDPTKVTTLRSAISVPLRSQEGMVGVLTLYRLRSDSFTGEDLGLLQAIAPKAGLAMRNAICFESAASAAETDELTGLPNARFLFAHMQREVLNAKAQGQPLGIAVMDLDGFKKANDRYGHLAGNRILQEVANGLRRHCAAGDVVARLGGDEFVLVTTAAGHELQTMVDQMISRVVEGLAKEMRGGATIGISAGVASLPEDGGDAEALFGKADDRMYEAKRLRKLQLVA